MTMLNTDIFLTSLAPFSLRGLSPLAEVIAAIGSSKDVAAPVEAGTDSPKVEDACWADSSNDSRVVIRSIDDPVFSKLSGIESREMQSDSEIWDHR